MMRLNLVLMSAVLTSALHLVGVQYDSRRLTTELDRARTDAHRKLQMRQASPAITTYVSYSAPMDGAAVATGRADAQRAGTQ